MSDSYPHLGADVELTECDLCEGSGNCPACKWLDEDDDTWCDLCENSDDCPACGGQGFVPK